MKTEIDILIEKVESRGITIEPHGSEHIRLSTLDGLSPAMIEKLRARKFEIIACLEHRAEVARVHLAKQIMLHEFDGCDDPTFRAITNSLTAWGVPLFERAIRHLREQRQQERKK